ncbi:hypothetical protein LSAT2_027786 [Lamellibrachia satsuma]|nr:hypothetical protein LSAT2_027786 [Lamellibrachia satsuma]
MNAIYGTVVWLTPHERHLRLSRRNGLYIHDGIIRRYPCSSIVTAFPWDRRCLRIQVVVDVARSNQPNVATAFSATFAATVGNVIAERNCIIIATATTRHPLLPSNFIL